VVKVALVGFPPFVLIACEYLLASAILLPVAGRSLLRTDPRVLLKAVGMGLLWLAGVCLMFVAMRTTSPSLSAFMVGQTVVITPLLVWTTGGGWPGGRFAGAVALVVGGMATLLLWGGELAYSGATALVLLAAIIYSVHIMVLGSLTHQAKALVLVLVQVLVTAAGSLILSLAFERWPAFPREFTRPAWMLILYGGIASSLLAFLLQTLGQRRTPTSRVGMYVGLESVFALIISVAVGLEALTWRMALGFSLVFAGTMLAQSGRRSRRCPDPLEEEPQLELAPPL
jgi:drug/metabolite transporter (DMT)-like permease